MPVGSLYAIATVCTRGSNRARVPGPSTHPFGATHCGEAVT